MSSRRRRLGCWSLVLAGVVLLATLYLGRASWLTAAARWLDVSDFDGPVSHALVLGGDPERRPFAAAAVVRAGLARDVLLTRPRPSHAARQGVVPRQEEIARRVLLHGGVPGDAIHLLGNEVRSTADEAIRLADFLRAEPEATIVALTSVYHTRRTRQIFRRSLGADAARVQYLGIPTEFFREDDWWQSKSGFLTYVREYLKTVYYWLRY